MDINFESLKEEAIDVLNRNPVWVLSTSQNDAITTRSMSVINIGLDIYFQTNRCYIKHNQMRKNKNVALCFFNVSIEGTAEEIGSWKEEKNKHVLNFYKEKHNSSFEAYGLLEGSIVYKIKPNKIKFWKYIDGKPLREILHINEKRAERLEFM